MTEKLAEGWGWPSDHSTSKAHYFVDRLALCRRWLYFGELFEGGDDKPTRCPQCRKFLAKRREQAAKAANG